MTIEKTPFEIDQKSRREIAKYDQLEQSPEFNDFKKLIFNTAILLDVSAESSIVQIPSRSFETLDQKIGFALLANYCFQKDMGLSGVSVTEAEQGFVNFAVKNGKFVGFMAEKRYFDDFDRNILYLDIVGVDPKIQSTGVAESICRSSIQDSLSTSNSNTIIVTRTQNPMMISTLSKAIGPSTELYPFDALPSNEWAESVNWLVNKGLISRNNRQDTFFDANKSLIYWGAYGKFGDGTTWENMVKGYNIDWNRSMGQKVEKYLLRYGSNINEMLTKGHALVVGAYFRK